MEQRYCHRNFWSLYSQILISSFGIFQGVQLSTAGEQSLSLSEAESLKFNLRNISGPHLIVVDYINRRTSPPFLNLISRSDFITTCPTSTAIGPVEFRWAERLAAFLLGLDIFRGESLRRSFALLPDTCQASRLPAMKR
ncbi:hypothetical protein Nepgr_011128 [Nepenthes gracilis]|uniref:Uncharacterized protein n=1 Tax=Nepenthes gracilis TaxID=150966 RepID=A0AAD3SEN5_NEPGR|nr:hypothetical protein Nepgr_011128 [Nepenthes gracilis]